MELKDYTTEQLKEELKRRNEEKRKERESVPRCRNCKHFEDNMKFYHDYHCLARTYIAKGIVRNYCTTPYTKACDKYEKI